jgi:hypothetical protein
MQSTRYLSLVINLFSIQSHAQVAEDGLSEVLSRTKDLRRATVVFSSNDFRATGTPARGLLSGE